MTTPASPVALPAESGVTTNRATARLPSLDIAKGIAILFVALIHAELFAPGAFHTHVVERAVPMFFVLFGITSTMWWDADRNRGALDWYRSRLGRLVPSYWLAVAAWWCGQRLLSSQPLGLDTLLVALTGYAPWLPTSWFVTAILQVVLSYPLLRVLVRRTGFTAAAVVTAAAMAICQVQALPLLGWLHATLPYSQDSLGFYPYSLFVIPYFWWIVAGAALETTVRRPSQVALAASALAVAAAGLFLANDGGVATSGRVVMAIADVPRTVVLVAFAQALSRSGSLGRALTWLGRRSWEAYLGQMAVYGLGYTAWTRYGGPEEHRLACAVVLAAGGIGFALATEQLRGRFRLASRGRSAAA